MTIRPFASADVPRFLALAVAEGWLSDPWEFAFLLGAFPAGCLVLEERGEAVAFVTAVRYGVSGWVGNLIVAREARGRGYGTLLMGRAMDELRAAGTRTVWLTASAAGRPLYGKMGFQEMDGIVRWSGTARGGGEGAGDPVHPDELMHLDRAGWGDDRSAVLAAVAARGAVLREERGFLLLHSCGDNVQVGPWTATDRDVAARLLDRALSRCPAGSRLLLDVPARNLAAASLLNDAGFTPGGSTVLMCRGERPAYVPERIFALATMGSIG